MPCADRGAVVGLADLGAVAQRIRPRAAAAQAADRLGAVSVRPAPIRPPMPEDLAAPQLEARCRARCRRRESLAPRAAVAAAFVPRLSAGRARRSSRPTMRRTTSSGVVVGGRQRSTRRAPSRSTVTRSAMREDLGHAVADVDDADAPRLAVRAGCANSRRLDLGQRRRRLVEDQHLAVERQRLGDLDQLLAGDAAALHASAAIDDRAQVAPAPSRRALAQARRSPSRRRAAGVGLRHEDVLGHRGVARTARSPGGPGRCPAACAAAGPAIRDRPRRRGRSRRSSGCRMPSMMFISVDLPAPFSPHSAWISPARSAKRRRPARGRAEALADAGESGAVRSWRAFGASRAAAFHAGRAVPAGSLSDLLVDALGAAALRGTCPSRSRRRWPGGDHGEAVVDEGNRHRVAAGALGVVHRIDQFADARPGTAA